MNSRPNFKMGPIPRFRIELSPPITEERMSSYCERFQHNLLQHSKCISLTSKNVRSISGLNRSMEFLNRLRNVIEPCHVLLHLTCFDLSRINLQSKLDLLQRHFNINNLLIVTGENYQIQQAENQSFYKESKELISDISEKFPNFTLATAGYPGSNFNTNNQESSRILEKVAQFKQVKTIYTQCIFKVQELQTFRKCLDGKVAEKECQQLEIVPSVAIFDNLLNLDKVGRLTRVGSAAIDDIREQLLKFDDPSEQRQYCKSYITDLIKGLIAEQPPEINICTFGLLEFAGEILEDLK